MIAESNFKGILRLNFCAKLKICASIAPASQSPKTLYVSPYQQQNQHLNTKFIDNMGLDSIELVMEWEKYFNTEIPDKEAVKMSTVQDAIEYISTQVEYSHRQIDTKEKLLSEFRNSIVELGINFSMTLHDNIFQQIPVKDHDTWKRISLETKLEMPEPLAAGALGKFIDRILPQKDNLELTTLDRFIDLLAAVNYEKIIDRNHIQDKYEVMIAVMGITIQKIGVSPFEVFLDSSFTKDLGID